MKLLLTALVALVATLTMALRAQEPAPKPLVPKVVAPTPWYPLKVGQRWIYRAVNAKALDAKPREVQIEVVREEDYKRVTADQNAKNGTKETLFVGFLLKSTSEGKVTYDHVVQMEDGVYRVSVSEKLGATGLVFTPPVRFLALPLEPGESWNVASTTQGKPFKGTYTAKKDSVVVPLGQSKDAILVSLREGHNEIDTWYVQGYGMLKQRLKLRDTETILELVKFEVKK